MTRRAGAIALLVSALGVATTGQSQTPPQNPPVFRANTDLITVPVFVRGSAAQANGLRATDFVLTDNGVPQTVDSIDSESLPVDVTVLIETSRALESYRKGLNEQVRKIAALVRPTDRIEVLGIDGYVAVLVPFGPPTRDLAVDRFTGGGLTSVNDALVAALLREADPDRRHLIIAMTDSIDTMSTMTMAAVREIARQSSATLVVSWVTLSEDEEFSSIYLAESPPWMNSAERLARHVRSASAATRRGPWTPHYDPPPRRTIYAFDALREAAEMTGGAVHPPGVFTDRNAAAIFDRIYAEFRRNVVLRYLPQGVARDGWHDVKVTLPRFPDVEIRARRGYFIEKDAPPPPAAAASPGALERLVAAGSGNDLDTLLAAVASAASPVELGNLLRALRAAGNIWPSDPRREFVTALVVADAAVHSTAPDVRQAGATWLAEESLLIRPPTGPDAFEREWVTAEVALLQGALDPAVTWRAVTTVAARLPDDPRVLLGRATIADQFMVVPGATGGRQVAPASVTQMLGFYDAAMAHAVTADEARIRKAWLLRRLHREDEARALLDAVTETADPLIRKWLELIRSAPAALTGTVDDPEWRAYWQGGYRNFGDTLTALHRAAIKAAPRFQP